MMQSWARDKAVWTSSLLSSGCLLLTIGLFLSVPSRGLAQRVLGIDVSAWQADITTANWATLKRATNEQVSGVYGDGRDFVFIRSSRGGTTGEDHRSGGYPAGNNTFTNLSQRYDDPYFVQNITRATAAGMLAGPYHFSRPDIIATTGNSGGIPNNGTDEANHFIQMAGAWMRPGYLLPVHDLEAGDGLRTDNEMAQFSIDFSDRIFEVMGIRPAIYINGNYGEFVLGRATSALQDAVVAAYPTLWTARWPNQTDPDSIPVQTMQPNDSISYVYGPWDNYGIAQPWAFWQYASTARLNGYANGTRNIDVDVAQGGIEFVKDYLVPALWVTNSDGMWTTLSNWNSGQAPVAPVVATGQLARVGPLTLPAARLPGSDDTVILDRPNADVTITLGSGVHTIRKLYAREALNITNGSLTINYVPTSDSTPIAAQVSAPVTLSGSGIFRVHTLQVDATEAFTLAGGTLTFNTINLMRHATSPGRIAMSGNVTMNPLSGATSTIAASPGAGSMGIIDLGGGTRTLNVGNGTNSIDLSIEVSLANGGLTKIGGGTLGLNTASIYNGGTTVSSGTLMVNNLAGSATGSGGVTVNGGALGGVGVIGGQVSILAGGTLSPGASIGALTINNSLNLAGLTLMEVNAETGASDLIRGMTSVTYGGTLVLSNISGTITASSAFKLFSANSYNGAFDTIMPATPGAGLAWNTNTLKLDGTLRVLSTAPVPVAKSLSGNLLTLSWPGDHIGWRLQAQTNSGGLTTNWVDVVPAVLTNRITFTVDPAAGSAFYRLIYP